MYRIGVKRRFNAAHRLEGHEGKCARLHGHTWCVEAVYSSAGVGDEAMVLDFELVREMLDNVVGPLDHRYLNEIEPFDSVRPTAENVARVVHARLLLEIKTRRLPVDLVEVTVWESPDTWASYGDA